MLRSRVRTFFWQAWLSFVALSAAGQGLSPNLVQNGSFESLGETINLPPWHNGAGRRPAVGIVVSEPWRTPDGNNFIMAQSFICQDIPTVAGRSYLFRFAFGGNEKVQSNKGPLYVSWGSQDVVTIPVTPVDSRYPRWATLISSCWRKATPRE